MANRYPNGRFVEFPQLRDREWLEREYVVRLRDAKTIAADIGCCTQSVHRAIHMHGIRMRTKGEAMRLAKRPVQYDEQEAVRLYEAGLSTTDIARQLHSTKPGIWHTLHRHGVKMRTKQEANRLRRDTKTRRIPKASESIGVVSRCAACDRTTSLELHHVNADPEDNRPENLIALCWEHHMLVELLVTKALSGLRARGVLQALT